MKKLFFGATIILGSILNTSAQTTILYQAFGSSAPAGWTQQLTSVNGGWKFGTSFGSTMQFYAPAQGDDAYVDDIDNNSGSHIGWDTLKTGTINCTAYTSVFLSLNYLLWVDNGNETGTIIVSNDNGLTWHLVGTLKNTQNVWVDSAIFNLSTYAAGNNVMVGFTYYNGYNGHTNGYAAFGEAISKIDVYAPVNYDVQVVSQDLPLFLKAGTPYSFTGSAFDSGGATITSMDMNYSVNHGTPVTQTIGSISGFNGLTSYSWSMNSTSAQFTPTVGTYTVRFWASNLNGSNSSPTTDTLVAHYIVVDSIEPKEVLFEEFSNASCNPCMHAMPNIDSVAQNTASYCNAIRYHGNAPGQDMINIETNNIFQSRSNYYSLPGVPYAEIDGAPSYATFGALSSGLIQKARAIGSPFKITVPTTEATFATSTKTYSLRATIESFGNFPAGLTAQVYLTEDSVDFKTDQSTEDPLSSFQPPIGTGSTYPDYYYPFIINFPDPVEDALPNTNGTTLGAFTAGSTQTVTVSWVQNHPWAAKYNTYKYDSSATQHLTIFIQDNSGNTAVGIPAKYVYQSKKVLVDHILGIEEISNGVSFGMYPNPTNNNTTLAYKLDKDQNVNVQVFNMLGQQVYSNNEGLVSSGEHTILINTSTLQNGIYFVKFNADNASTTKKLIIQK